jgi:hypothetical protein
MSDAPRRSAQADQDPTRDTAEAGRDQRLEQQVVNLLRSWIRRSREAASVHTEAALDRASFESFPASDPVAPAAASNDRRPSLEEIDCTMSTGELVFRCASPAGSATRDDRPPPASVIEGDTADGGRIRVRVWVEDAAPGDAVPSTLELEPVHASLKPNQHERRVGAERRTASRKMPQGFDRRQATRRGAAPAA